MSERVLELWRFREVIRNFVSQDLKVKYRRSSLGFLWSLLNPLLMMIVLSLVFAHLFIGIKGTMTNYTLYLLSGSLPWIFFAATVDGCCVSIIENEGFAKRQYFPKLVFPLARLGQHLVTLLLSMVALLAAMGPFIDFRFSWALAVLPLSFLCLIAIALGVGAAVAALTVYFRDTQHLVQVALTAFYFLTPILWPMSAQSERRHIYFKMNPMYHVLEMFRAPIY
ncbi:MAG: ABC transporter permease, partial [Planctomycetota bacterium]|nr:ABC transporter permease [Planctomycetota bacterium]